MELLENFITRVFAKLTNYNIYRKFSHLWRSIDDEKLLS